MKTNHAGQLARLLALLVAGVFIVSGAEAQTNYGTIRGTVRDSAGAVVPGVEVSAINEHTGVAVSQLTNSAGAYVFSTLFPGSYTIQVAASGFQPVEVTGIQLQVNQTARYDLELEIGDFTESLEVVASAPLLATDSTDVGQVIENRQIVDLPLDGRAYLQLASLTSGVVSTGERGGDSAGPNFVSQGNRIHSNSFLVGGIDTRTQRGGTYGLSLSVDAIGEFKILQNAFDAEYGRGMSIVNSTIKSGTNEFHGTAFEFVRNDALDARNAFARTKSPLRQHQFGFSLGGPIARNRTFFFVNFEAERQRRGDVTNALLPTQAQLSGDLSSMDAVAIDPETGLPFPNNIIPDSRISQFARAGHEFFVTPNDRSTSPGTNHLADLSTSRDGEQFTLKLDHHLSDSVRLDGFLSYFKWSDHNPGVNPFAGNAASQRTFPTFGLTYTHTLGPNLITNIRVGRYHSDITRTHDEIADRNISTELFGLRNLNPDSFAFAPPFMSIAGFASAGGAAWQPTGARDVNDQITPQVTWVKGRNVIKFGADLRWLQYDDQGWATQNGRYFFNGQYTGNAVADYLLGIPDFAHVAQREIGNNYGYELRHGEYSFYAQNSMKLTSHLTMNIGLRYELVQFPLEVNDAVANWNFDRGTMDLAGVDIPRRIVSTDKNNWAPRAGLAYNPSWSPKTVIRAGAGIVYGNFRQHEAGLQHFHPPLVNENFLTNDLPEPTFTTDTLWGPPISDLENADLAETTVNWLRDKEIPESYQWNLNVQHEFLPHWLLELGYVGNRSVKLPVRWDANQAEQFDPNNPKTVQERRPFQNVGFVSGNTSLGFSSYHAFDVRVERRFAGGLAILASYSWNKQMALRDFDQFTVMSIDNIRHNYGPTGAPHRAVISYLYELPFGRGQRLGSSAQGFLNQLIGGWQIAGITTLRAGNFLNATTDASSGAGDRSGNKPDVTGLPVNLPADQRTVERWFNADAFVEPPFPRFGNAGQGLIRGPGVNRTDLSIFKNVTVGAIRDNFRIQFRAEMFNVFNRVNLDNPNTNASSSLFGTIAGAADARIIQLGLKLLF